jgi:hypothetical protein
MKSWRGSQRHMSGHMSQLAPHLMDLVTKANASIARANNKLNTMMEITSTTSPADALTRCQDHADTVSQLSTVVNVPIVANVKWIVDALTGLQQSQSVTRPDDIGARVTHLDRTVAQVKIELNVVTSGDIVAAIRTLKIRPEPIAEIQPPLQRKRRRHSQKRPREDRVFCLHFMDRQERRYHRVLQESLSEGHGHSPVQRRGRHVPQRLLQTLR